MIEVRVVCSSCGAVEFISLLDAKTLKEKEKEIAELKSRIKSLEEKTKLEDNV